MVTKKEYYARAVLAGSSPSEHVVSSAIVVRGEAHDMVRLWNRGALTGEIMLAEGDGELLAAMLGLEERLP